MVVLNVLNKCWIVELCRVVVVGRQITVGQRQINIQTCLSKPTPCCGSNQRHAHYRETGIIVKTRWTSGT